jgi:hypothetical protein
MMMLIFLSIHSLHFSGIMLYFAKNSIAMEVKEPVIAYGTLSAPVEEMQNKVIAAVRELTDLELLNRCYKLVCGDNARPCELDLALKEMRQGNLKSYESVDSLLASLKAQGEI